MISVVTKTPDLRRRIAAVAVLGLVLVAAPPVAAAELEFLFGNDLFSSDVDDRYSAMLGLAFATERVRYSLYENLFTDDENQIRFDETHLVVDWEAEDLRGWRMNLGGGVVHVGEGLLGQDFQNWFHRLINRSEQDLPYIEEDELYARVRFDADRSFELGGRWSAGPWIESDAAFGFKWHAAAGGVVRWRRGPRIGLHGLATARYSAASLDALEPWVDGWAPAGEIGFRYAQILEIAYSYNAYGTEDVHLHLHLSVAF